jgi:hypothetical protein
MSADHLPEDLRRWPRDPYQVLGVPPHCDPLEARRAYTRLIRHFKPEQYPEHFRLIREAYDAVKRMAEYRQLDQQDDEDGPETPVADAPVGPIAGDRLQTLWDLACDGREQEAYTGLREMYEANPHSSELPARLYAMLLANPELDPRRVPCDWLVRGVRGEGPWGPCRQLYRREIDDHPDEVLSDRFGALLDEVRPARQVLDFLAWRWEALVRLDRAELIAADLRRVAPRLEHEDEEGWVRVLLKAADYLAWQRDGGFVDHCKAIESHVHLHAALGEDLSRLDVLRDLSASWHRLARGPLGGAPLMKVVPLSWANPFESRHRILADCRTVADNPEAALEQLDAVHRQGPLVLTHLGQTLGWLWHVSTDPRDEEALVSAIEDHLQGLGPAVSETDYALYRRYLMRLCVAEVIAPETVAAVHYPDRATFAHQRILDDWPLRVVCLAHRLIWV